LASNLNVVGANSPSVSLEVISTARGTVGAADGGLDGGACGAAAVINSNESKTCLAAAGNGVGDILPEGIVAKSTISIWGYLSQFISLIKDIRLFSPYLIKFLYVTTE
jgi:hypothetical protein